MNASSRLSEFVFNTCSLSRRRVTHAVGGGSLNEETE